MAGHEHDQRQAEAEAEAESPIIPDVIFTRDPTDPRYFAKPGEGYRPYGNAPSRAMMLLTWVLILGVLGLGVFVIVSAVVGR